ncbi:hypothetical protein ACFKCF_06410 [Nonomuraea sp. JJY05]
MRHRWKEKAARRGGGRRKGRREAGTTAATIRQAAASARWARATSPGPYSRQVSGGTRGPPVTPMRSAGAK